MSGGVQNVNVGDLLPILLLVNHRLIAKPERSWSWGEPGWSQGRCTRLDPGSTPVARRERKRRKEGRID